ncbi:hypothetical protein F2Q69_00028243 [Brassica cretica]|uniref:Uncharacterized protein n=1 Tax=Brassica cretica TaxID=69181 RepID=A0A8S9RS94_BRACR|nr:hypothetical protein F2Q69_00028243 [Brassica cretica]
MVIIHFQSHPGDFLFKALLDLAFTVCGESGWMSLQLPSYELLRTDDQRQQAYHLCRKPTKKIIERRA